MCDKMVLSIVIPTFNSSDHIKTTLDDIAAYSDHVPIEIIIVDDASDDGTAGSVISHLRTRTHLSWTVIELSKNFGQSAATAVGLTHATGDLVVTVDDDLTYPIAEVTKLMSMASETNDFVVGAPIHQPRSLYRRVATRIVRLAGVRLLKTPRDFIFSSFFLYKRSFLDRIKIEEIYVDEIGWMFRDTKRYCNVEVRRHPGVRSHSTYGFRSLLRAAKPLASLLTLFVSRLSSYIALFGALLALLLAGRYLARQLLEGDLAAGFPTLATLILVNVALSAYLLLVVTKIQQTVYRTRRSDVFRCQFRVTRGNKSVPS